MSDAKRGPPRRSATGESRARWVALGILTSRASGLVRSKVFAWVFGIGAHKDVLDAAFRVPNLLQNLLGDQAMAAAFIPVYSRLLAAGRREEAGRLAGAVFGLLLAVVALAVAAGVAAAPWLVAIFNAGFLGDAAEVAAGTAGYDRYPLAVRAARVVFPMTGLLVLAAWAQAVLNSHRRFFLAYVAPVLWNAAIVTVLLGVFLGGGGRPGPQAAPDVLYAAADRWVLAACGGALLGGLLQFLIQLPLVLRLMAGFRIRLALDVPHLRDVLRAFGPALAGRGVVQLSLYLDLLLATLLRVGAVGALTLAGQIYALPLSAFAMSVAASELPELASAGEGDDSDSDGDGDGDRVAEAIGQRLAQALRQAAFLVAPATVGLLAFGLPVVALFRGGAFDRDDQVQVYLVLCGYALGLLASTTSRLLQNTFYALRDTATPARVATVRVAASALVGAGAMVLLDRVSVTALVAGPSAAGPDGVATTGPPLFLGALGLSLGAALASWLELGLLRRALARRLPRLRLPFGAVARTLLGAVLAALPAALLWWSLPDAWGLLATVLVPATYAATYLGLAWLRGAPELALWLGRTGGGGRGGSE